MNRFIYARFIIIIVAGFTVYAESDHSRVSSNGDCVNPTGDHGVCRNINDCKFILALLIRNKSKSNSRVIEFIRKSHCGFDGLYPVVCCPFESDSEKMKNSQERINLKEKQESLCLNEYTPKTCGNIQISDKIIGGSTTTLNEFPWMALIGYETRTGIQYRCGGTLISPFYVLTAAHCLFALRDIVPKLVRLGEYNLATKSDCERSLGCAPPPIDIPIQKIIPHPLYYRPELRNDIALIKLARRVNMTDSVRAICLPVGPSLGERNLTNEKAVVTGWGTTETGMKSSVLLKATLPIVPLEECSDIYKRQVPITESQICAGGELGKDSCSGDSGGPLQVISLNSAGQPVYVQHGIVSFGPKNCGSERRPGVYTKVAHYTDWILENIRPTL